MKTPAQRWAVHCYKCLQVHCFWDLEKCFGILIYCMPILSLPTKTNIPNIQILISFVNVFVYLQTNIKLFICAIKLVLITVVSFHVTCACCMHDGIGCKLLVVPPPQMHFYLRSIICVGVDKCSAQCLLCNKAFVYNGGTSNLISHLQRKHQSHRKPEAK